MELEKKPHEVCTQTELQNLSKDVTAEISGKTVIFRSEMKGCSEKVFQAADVAIPSAVRFV